MSELKPCPFCGMQPKDCDTPFVGEVAVICRNRGCNAIGPGSEVRNHAIKLWNTRATDVQKDK